MPSYAICRADKAPEALALMPRSATVISYSLALPSLIATEAPRSAHTVFFDQKCGFPVSHTQILPEHEDHGRVLGAPLRRHP